MPFLFEQAQIMIFLLLAIFSPIFFLSSKLSQMYQHVYLKYIRTQYDLLIISILALTFAIKGGGDGVAKQVITFLLATYFVLLLLGSLCFKAKEQTVGQSKEGS